MDRNTRIVLAGGGIGGLTAGLALVQRGFDVRIYEQAPELREVGAGLTMSRGAMRSLDTLGITDALNERMSRTTRFPFLHYTTGEVLVETTTNPSGSDSEARLAPGHMFRADLHNLLAEEIRAIDPDAIRLGARVEKFSEDADGVTVTFADGTTTTGDALIGCDGVRSSVRAGLFGHEDPEFTGRIAYRFLVPAAEATHLMGDAGPAAVFIGPSKTFNRYLIAGGTVLNCVAMSQTDTWADEGWSHLASREELLAEFAGWHPDILGLMKIAPADQLIRWGIFQREPRTSWTRGSVSLLGDAAHPMLPFLGLGATMAIEDGVILGRAFDELDSVAEVFAHYEAARIPRTTKVFNGSVRQGEVFDTTDPAHYPPADAPAHDRSFSDYDSAAVAL